MRRFVAPVCFLFLATLFVSGRYALADVTKADRDEERQLDIIKMTVTPAAEPKPAMKYHFLVPPVDQIHDNAATMYYKAMANEEDHIGYRHYLALEQDEEKWAALFDGPLDKLPQKEAEECVGWLSNYFDELRRAARCDHCDWMDNIREYGIATPLPQAQASRAYCNVLALRARLQISQGILNDAIETLGAGYAWSRNWGRSPTLVQCLIGMAFQGVLNDQTRALIAFDNSPNLYWALTDLAEQPIDMRQALSYESKMLEFTIHGIDELDRRTFSPEEVLRLAKQVPQVTSRGVQNLASTFVWAVQLQPEARKYLLARGYTAEKLDAMPILQVVLLYRWRQFEVVRDDSFKFLQLPDGEIRDAVNRSDEVVKTAWVRREGAPFIDLLPAVHASQYARLRSMRHINQLRIVEALRMYAAEHGRWPVKLGEITAVPVPRDPFTDKPFEYSSAGGVAILTPPADAGQGYSPASGAQRYELTLKKPATK